MGGEENTEETSERATGKGQKVAQLHDSLMIIMMMMMMMIVRRRRRRRFIQ